MSNTEYRFTINESKNLTPPFGTLLWASLKQAGLTQAELHRRTGIGQNRISDYARGYTIPSWETGCRLLRACGAVVAVSVVAHASAGNEEEE